MNRDRSPQQSLSEFVRYLAENGRSTAERLPALSDLSLELSVSVASLREQLEVARALGMVEVRPKTGIRPLPYSFRPAVMQSLAYAVLLDPNYFQEYSDLRNHIEASYWHQAAGLLDAGDIANLRRLILQARQKLHGSPIQIPHAEHRELHLSIYGRLNNPFVLGLLEGYWEMYEAVGLSVYADIRYLEQVWDYHEKMVEAVAAGDIEGGYRALTEHMDLLLQRSDSIPTVMDDHNISEFHFR